MKLLKQLIPPPDVPIPHAVLLIEADNPDTLKRHAEELARKDGELEPAWMGNDDGYAELTVRTQYRLVVRP